MQYEIDTPLIELIGHDGEARAVRAYRRGCWAIDELGSLVSELNQPCGFVRRQTLCLASSAVDVAALEREYECRRHFGFDVRYFESEPVDPRL